jgi:hypothetical protein
VGSTVCKLGRGTATARTTAIRPSNIPTMAGKEGCEVPYQSSVKPIAMDAMRDK